MPSNAIVVAGNKNESILGTKERVHVEKQKQKVAINETNDTVPRRLQKCSKEVLRE